MHSLLPLITKMVLGISCQPHIDSAARKCNKLLHGLRHLKNYLDRKKRAQAMTIIPLFCSLLWFRSIFSLPFVFPFKAENQISSPQALETTLTKSQIEQLQMNGWTFALQRWWLDVSTLPLPRQSTSAFYWTPSTGETNYFYLIIAIDWLVASLSPIYWLLFLRKLNLSGQKTL